MRRLPLRLPWARGRQHLHAAGEEAMNRPQKNKGGKGVRKRCAFCHSVSHDASSCNFMSRSAADRGDESKAVQAEYDATPKKLRQKRGRDYINPERYQQAQTKRGKTSTGRSSTGRSSRKENVVEEDEQDMKAQIEASRGRGGRGRGRGLASGQSLR
eukprot:2172605-Pleurochrysis_carterae.AAC.1